MQPRVSVIIPVLNEERSIGKVIQAISPDVCTEIIVVDNGSTDKTSEIAASMGARVVYEPKKGYGSACWAGVKAASSPDIVVFLDGDYSDYPEELNSLVEPVFWKQADLVIGSRILGVRERGALPAHSVFGNRLASAMLRLLFGIKCTDLGPFRAISYRVLISLDMRDRGFGWTMEMQAKAAARGYTVIEVPVSYRKRIGRSKITGSLINSCRAGWMITTTCLKIALMEKVVVRLPGINRTLQY